MGSFPKRIMIQNFQDYTFTNLRQSWSVNLMVCIINMLIFIFIITGFFFIIIFCFLIARDKNLLFYKGAILSFGYHRFILLSLFFLSEPSTSPHNIKSEKMNETTYRISWNPLPRNTSNGRVIAYEVNQTKLFIPGTSRSVSTPSILQNTSDTFIVLTDLLSCSVYKVEVRAYTSAGPGVFGSMAYDIVTSGI